MTSRPGPKYERRATTRTRLAPGCLCRLVVPPDHRCRSGVINDVSRDGVGLILPDAVPVGALLAIRPQGLTQPDRVCGLRVRHLRPLPDGRWLLGCSHAEDLSAAEVRTLLDALEAARGQTP